MKSYSLLGRRETYSLLPDRCILKCIKKAKNVSAFECIETFFSVQTCYTTALKDVIYMKVLLSRYFICKQYLHLWQKGSSEDRGVECVERVRVKWFLGKGN